MGALIYINGSYYPLRGQTVFSGGQQYTIKAQDKIFIKGLWYSVGRTYTGFIIKTHISYIATDWYSTTVTTGDGQLDLFLGGTANSTTLVNQGSLLVNRGCTATETTVNSTAWLTVFKGGTANSTTINEGGTMALESGAIADGITLNPGGQLILRNSSRVSNIINLGGTITYIND